VYVCGQGIVQTLTGIDFHRGCLALARRPSEPLPLSHFGRARRLLALEGIGNPDNLGGLALGARRTARQRVSNRRADARPQRDPAAPLCRDTHA
jgi:tRNA G18 (ribose-2'-O)-methylase SpoU